MIQICLRRKNHPSHQIPLLLTPWKPVYQCIVPGNQPKTSSFRLLYQRHSSSADCASLHSKNNFLVGGESHHKWSSFWAILANVTWPRAQLLGQSISLKFSLETTLESESFEPLFNFLAFLVQKLWPEINKLIINYPINQIFYLLHITTFEPETPAGHPKYQKTQIVA